MKRKPSLVFYLVVAGLFFLTINTNSKAQGIIDVIHKVPTIQIQTGHNFPILKVEYSKCGKYVVSYDKKDGFAKSGSLIVWDIKTERMLGQLADKVFLSISPDNLFICFNNNTDEFEFWDFETLKIKKSFKRQSDVYPGATSFTKDGKYMATGIMNKVLIYELSSGNIIQNIDIPFYNDEPYAPINQVTFNPDNSVLAVSTFYGNVFFFSTKTWSQIKEITHDDDSFSTHFSYSPDGKMIVLAYVHKNFVEVFSTTDYKLINTRFFPNKGTWGAAYAQISKDGKALIVCAQFGPIYIFDTNNWDMKKKIETSGSEVLDFSRNKEFFVAAENSSLKVYTLDGTFITSYGKNIKMINNIDYNRDLQVLCTSSPADIQIWNMKELKLNYALKGYTDAKLSPKGNYLGANRNESINYDWFSDWILVDLNKKKVIKQDRESVFGRTLAFSNDEKNFIHQSGDYTIKIVETKDGSLDVVYFREFEDKSSADIFGVNPVSNELIVFGRKLGMAYYNFNSKWYSYIENSGVSKKNNRSLGQMTFSPTGEDFAFSYREGNDEVYSKYKLGKKKMKELISIPGHYGGLGYSSDGKKLAIPCNPFKVVDAESGKLLKEFPLHNSEVSGLIFTNKDKNLYSSSHDGTIKLWDYESGKEIFTFIPAVNSEDYIFLTPDGYYKTTRLGTSAVHYLQNNKVITFDQLDLKYNRPDILLKRTGADSTLVNAYYRAYLKRLKKMGFTEKDLEADLNLPELVLLTNDIPVKTENKQMSIKVKASDKMYELNRINLYVNDVPVYGQQGIDLKSQHIKETEKELSFELSAGANKVQVSTMNSAGVESFRENFVTNYSGAIEKPSLYLVSIGVSDYLNKDFNLTYAAKDAQDLETLAKTDTGKYAAIKTILLTNENATTKNILEAKTMLQKSKTDDVVIIFVASHGLLDDNLDYYIATNDCDFNKPSINGLAYDKLESLLDGIPARNKLLLIDACHSGEVDKDENVIVSDNSNSNTSTNGVKSRGFKTFSTAKPANSLGLKNSFELMNEIFTDIRKGTGAFVISSASGMEFAFESSEWKNGVFTYSLLEGVRSMNADVNKDGTIAVTELKDYVIKRVQELTNGKQNPTSRVENLGNDFRFW